MGRRAEVRRRRNAQQWRCTAFARGSGEAGLRVGFVNSQGLQASNWWIFQKWIEQVVFDVLFVAETWYMGWPEYARWSRTLAATTRPSTKTGSRYKGGLCVLGTPIVSSRMVGSPEVQEGAITIQVGGWRLSGVYLPPSMPTVEVTGILSQLTTSDVIVGDYNAFWAAGLDRGTPPERVLALSTWAQTTMVVPLTPDATPSPMLPYALAQPREKQGPDHAFVRAAHSAAMLHLLDCGHAGVSTDHRAILMVTLPALEQASLGRALMPPVRFWNHRLSRLEVFSTASRYWIEQTCTITAVEARDVDSYHQALVLRCQQVAGGVLGRASPRHNKSVAALPVVEDGSMTATLRLLRRLMACDRENTALLATTPGGDVIAEAVEMLSARLTRDPKISTADLRSHGCAAPSPARPESPFTTSSVRDTIQRLPVQRACAGDGIHLRLLQALVDTTFLDALTGLFQQCWATQATPAAWNVTDVCFVAKDKQQPKTLSNARPITLICIFRKVFETILLSTFDGSSTGWAKVHPAQAGFRRTYSTLTHAAILHLLLASRAIETVVFLDFRAAFDVVDHSRLFVKLTRRGCPPEILGLLWNLNCHGMYSRVIANGLTSLAFPRTRGLLQGSPLSPILFNLFIDDLLWQSDPQSLLIPPMLFYADDGAMLGPPGVDIQPQLDVVCDWASANGIDWNIDKCGQLSTSETPRRLYLGEDLVPLTPTYTYLGFPVAKDGIDWSAHLSHRLEAVTARIRYLSFLSKGWGVGHRLQVYKQYLAPMFEYGAALVYPWIQSTPPQSLQRKAIEGMWKEVVGWIADGNAAWRVTANLLGLLDLPTRFCGLHAMFQWQLHQAGPNHPLSRLLSASPQSHPFAGQLCNSPLYQQWRYTTQPSMHSKASLCQWLTRWKSQMLGRRRMTGVLLRLTGAMVNPDGLTLLRDHTLTAPYADQQLLFRYRRGTFAFGLQHSCLYVDRTFRRGDEDCVCFRSLTYLSSKRRQEKQVIQQEVIGSATFTTVDYWIYIGRLDRAVMTLRLILSQLQQQFIDASTK